MKIVHGAERSLRGWSRQLAVEMYSGNERLPPTQSNFPALKHFWDMNHIAEAVLLDTVGTQHVTADAGRWLRTDEGFAKWEITGGNYAPASFAAPRVARQSMTMLKETERTRCEVWARVIGYHRPTTSFNKGKQSERKERRHFTESATLKKAS